MFSAAARTLTRRCPRWIQSSSRLAAPRSTTAIRSLSSSLEDFTPSPPSPLTLEIAEGISNTTQFFIRHGVSQQQLQNLASQPDMSAVEKWQKMMEIYLMTQVHVIASVGYAANEQGLAQYAQDLASCIQSTDQEMMELFTSLRRDTWRELVATAFGLDTNDLPSLEIVEARNLMHKVASKMMEPDILLEVQTRTAKIESSDPEMELAQKHQILQDVIVNTVYLGRGGDDDESSLPKSLVEEAGFGTGAQGYAKAQCAMSDYEGDPLVAEYASSAMKKLWQAAGLDVGSLQPGA